MDFVEADCVVLVAFRPAAEVVAAVGADSTGAIATAVASACSAAAEETSGCRADIVGGTGWAKGCKIASREKSALRAMTWTCPARVHLLCQ